MHPRGDQLEHAADYLARIITMLPKQVSVEHNAAMAVDDESLDELIAQLHERLLAAREEQALGAAAQIRLLPNAPH